MPTFDDLLKLAERIEDKNLREKTIKFLKKPTVTNTHIKIKPVKWEEAPAGPESFHHGYPGGLIDHTYSVTNMCIMMAEHFNKLYKIDINMDVLIASALLHDAIKVYEWKMGPMGVERNNIKLDHTAWGTAELYANDFPEEVLHCVAAHAGDMGTTKPETAEATILHTMDNFDATFEHSLKDASSMQQIMMLDPKMIEEIMKNHKEE